MMRDIPRSVWYIVGAAFLVRLVFFLAVLLTSGDSAFMTGDSRGFLQIARNVAEGRGISQSDSAPFLPDSRFPPIFALTLGGSLYAFGSFLPILILNMILGSIVPLFAYRMGAYFTPLQPEVPPLQGGEEYGVRKVHGKPQPLGRVVTGFTENRKTGIIAAILAAFEPLTLILSLLLIPHPLSLIFLLSAVLLFIIFLESRSAWHACASGAFLGLSVLVRPHGKLLFLFAFLFFIGAAFRELRAGFIIRRIVVPAAAFFLASIIVLSPWAIRNYYHFGTFDISSTGLRNIYTDFAVSVVSYKTGEAYGDVEAMLEEDFARRHGIAVKDIDRDPQWGNLLFKEGIGIIARNPKEAIFVFSITMTAFFTQDLYMYFSQVFGVLEPGTIDFSPSMVLAKEGPAKLFALVWDRLGFGALIPLAGRILWVGFFALSSIGFFIAISRRGRERTLALLFGFLIVYHAATSLAAGFSAHGFHRYPANVFFFILLSYALVAFISLRTGIRARASAESAP